MTVAFEGSEGQLRVFLESAPQLTYVYILARPEGTPFYVGEGKNSRVFQHAREARLAHRSVELNPYKCNVIRKIENSGQAIIYRIESFHTDKLSAQRREGELIRSIGRLHEGGPLTNLAGGQENSGSPAPYSTEKHAKSLSGEADDPQTCTLNMFFQSIATVKSVPIKPLRSFRSRVRRTTMQTKPDKFSSRNAGAIVASAVCHGITIQSGAVIPRRFIYSGIEAVIENGVCENITGRRVAVVLEAEDPLNEKIVLGQTAPRLIQDLLGVSKLRDLGVQLIHG
jgi:hypothetical protein